MKTSLKRSMQPQATGLTFALLALVMIGFGVFAQHHAPKHPAALTGEVMTSAVTNASNQE